MSANGSYSAHRRILAVSCRPWPRRERILSLPGLGFSPGTGARRAADPQREAGAQAMTEPGDTVAAWTPRRSEREAMRGVSRAASTLDELTTLRVRFLGRRATCKQALRQVRDRETGMTLNASRAKLEEARQQAEQRSSGRARPRRSGTSDRRHAARRARPRAATCTRSRRSAARSRTSSSASATRSSTAARSRRSTTSSTR